jgi:hypothetical protein
VRHDRHGGGEEVSGYWQNRLLIRFGIWNFGFQILSAWCIGQRAKRLNLRRLRIERYTSYETFSFSIKLVASMAGLGLNSKQIERRTSVSFPIRLAAFQAGGWAEP